jgi:2,4-dienoyl-CoA reductase-like NADH-dependent reductase (Old Yellow Enzyme family)/thioredoxin reductase
MNKYKQLFSPIKIGSLELPNRFVFAATSSELGDRDGYVHEDMAEYYAERARGGTGLIVVEATYIEQEGKRLHHNAMLHNDSYIPGLKKIADAIHDAGGKVALQLNHGGRESIPEISGSIPLAPSPITSKFNAVGEPVPPKELTLSEIDRIVDRFAQAALRSKIAGYDAIELHGAHGYLIGQFLSPIANLREDAYGGNFTRRARFYIEIIQATKKLVGQDFPIICRMNGRDIAPGGLELDEAVEIAKLLEKAGADSISVSGGIHSSRPYSIVPGMSVPRGCYVEFSEAVKKQVKVPVMTVGRIHTPELAEEILNKGQADFICLSRALIADPYFPAKAKNNQSNRIVPCIACNECLATIHQDKGIACTMNPFVSRELEFKLLLAKKPSKKRVAILGSGAAGMAAAVTAAQRGHEVHLYEKSSELGGQLNLAFKPPHREEIENALLHFKSELNHLNVSIHLNSQLDEAAIRKLNPDSIIMATGAGFVKPEILGAQLPHVLTGWKVLSGTEKFGSKCVVIGGGLVGMEVADYLVERGSQVVLIARTELLKKAVHADRVYFLDRIQELDIEVLTNTDIIKIESRSLHIKSKNRMSRILTDVDNVILCTGYQSRREESKSLEKMGIPVYFAGDVLGSRKFFEAIQEGTLVSLQSL